jgi:hypothetical protein
MSRGISWILGSCVLAASLTVASVPAGAAGNPELSARIIVNPVPGWPVSQSASVTATAALQKEMKGTYKGGTIATAVQDWLEPTNPTGFAAASVSLTAYLDPYSSLDKQLLKSIPSYARITCPGLSGKPAVSTTKVPSIPGGLLTVCTKTTVGTNTADVVTFAKHNVFALVSLISPVPGGVVAMAHREYAALPNGDFSPR